MNRSTAMRPSLPFVSRRNLLQAGAATIAASAVVQAAHARPNLDESEDEAVSTGASTADRAAVLAAGMTEQEADCWEWTAKAAGAFFELPELHPMDASEVANAIHIIQNKLLSRPTYRKYRAAHKANAEASEKKANEQ